MSFAAVGSLGSANDKTAGTTIALAISADAEAGNLVVVWVAFDNESTTDGDTSQLSIADASGNTWLKLYEKTETSGAADDGVVQACFVSVLDTQINSGASITVTSTSSRTASAILAYEFTVGAGSTVELADGTNLALSQAASGQPGSISTSGMTSEEHLHLYCYAVEGTQTITGYDTMTDAGGNGTTGGAGDTNIRVEPAYHIGTNTGLAMDATASSGAQWIQVLVAIREVAGGGQTVAVNTVVETDTALPVGRAKTETVGVAVETDAALALGRAKTDAVGAATETDAAGAVGRAKARTTGTAAETDAALAVGRRKTRTVGLVATTEVALAVGRVKSRAIGIALDTQAALPITRAGAMVVPIGTVTDTSLALPMGRVKRRTLPVVVEIDGEDQIPTVNVGSGVWSGYWVKPAVTSGIADPDGGTGAYELATADNVSPPNYSGLFMLAANAGVANPVVGEVREIRVWLRCVSGTLAMTLSVDDSNPSSAITLTTTWREYRLLVTRTGTGNNRIFQLTEQVAANTAWQIYQPRSVLARARPITRVKSRPLTPALETDLALAIGRAKRRALTIATETNVAMPIVAQQNVEIVTGMYDPGTPAGQLRRGTPTGPNLDTATPSGQLRHGNADAATYDQPRPRKVMV